MSGMGMDPMAASQGMFGGYGMNMNSVNNGMNMGMNFNMGQGMYGAWDGQNNMWNGGPDKFNANAFPNRMGADFGANPGYHGYNISQAHGNFPQIHHQQQYASNDLHGSFGPPYARGRGRGRGFVHGGRGRGNFPTATQGNYPSSNLGPLQHQLPQQFQQQDDSQPQNQSQNHITTIPIGTTTNLIDLEHVKQFNDELCPGGEDERKEDQPKDEILGDRQKAPDAEELNISNGTPGNPDAPAAGEIPAIPTTEQNAGLPPGVPSGPAAHREHGDAAPGAAHRGAIRSQVQFCKARDGGQLANGTPQAPSPKPSTSANTGPPTEPRGQGVVGAPAAPRAMREGLPNTGMRNKGFPILGRATVTTQRHDRDSRRFDGLFAWR
jgi:hypothetical protein